jgi:hypothetical protein
MSCAKTRTEFRRAGAPGAMRARHGQFGHAPGAPAGYATMQSAQAAGALRCQRPSNFRSHGPACHFIASESLISVVADARPRSCRMRGVGCLRRGCRSVVGWDRLLFGDPRGHGNKKHVQVYSISEYRQTPAGRLNTTECKRGRSCGAPQLGNAWIQKTRCPA